MSPVTCWARAWRRDWPDAMGADAPNGYFGGIIFTPLIGWRATRLRDSDGVAVIVPNATLAGATVTNYGASGATYDTFIPGDGLLVWHIDDAITSSRGINAVDPTQQNTVNSGSPHYGVSIVPITS